jgi:signal peptidase II
VKNLKLHHYFLISLGVIALDQLVKYLMYQHMFQEVMPIFGNWFKLHYTTNDGMAFGLKIPGNYGKVFLSSFRLVAMFGIAYYMVSLFKKGAPIGLQICIALVFGGAIGNLVDSMFYGLISDDLLVKLEEGVVGSFGGGHYIDPPFKLFHGRVIDMFYIDIASGYYPQWLPFMGGKYYNFWPIFNVADASIFVAVIFIAIKQKVYFKEESKQSEENQSSTQQ